MASNRQHFLLDAAKKNTGSDRQTALAVGQSRHRVSNWRSGRQSIPVGDVVLLAALAGLDPQEWANRAIVSTYDGSDKARQLELALHMTHSEKMPGDA